MRLMRALQAGASCSGLLLAGCAAGPDFHRPGAPPGAAYANLPAARPGAQRVVPGADVPADWWTLFHSPALDGLVRQAVAANPDLAAARAALRQAQALARADRAALSPNVGLDVSTTRARNPGVLASPLQSDSNLYTLHTAQLEVGYPLDLFGGLGRQAEASAGAAEAQRFQAEAAYLTLTATVVVAAITEASLRDQIAATENSIAAQARILEILRGRLRLGDASRADVAAQETLLAQTEQSLPPLHKQRTQQDDLIAALAGQTPGRASPRLDMASLSLPPDLPLSLPARLVDQRPDVRAAEADLHAAAAQVGVAIAARLPAVMLGGAAGGSSTDFATLLAPENVLWSVVGRLTAPLFDGGALRQRQRAAEAAYDQAKAQYQAAVLTAFRNVSDTLAAIGSDTDGRTAAERAARAAADSLAIAHGQAALGAIAPLQVLNAEQAYWQSDLSAQEARAAVYADTVALFQALGGGWWNRGGPATENPGRAAADRRDAGTAASP